MKYKLISELFIFLSFIVLLAACSGKEEMQVKIANPTAFDRTSEMVEIPYSELSDKLNLETRQQFVIVDSFMEQVPFQILKYGSDSARSVIFPVTLNAESSIVYTIKKGIPEIFPAEVFGRLVPERKDDFAWENNRIAFRMYGPALETTGEISNGIDVWAKSTGNLIIDKWYKNDLAGIAFYHEDHGEGLDCYKVGRTLGAGAAAPFVNDTLWLGNNFVSYKILDNGPLRLTFQLQYAPFAVAGHEVTETRTFSLNANSQLNKVTEYFQTDITGFTLACGIVTRPEEGGIKDISDENAQSGFMAYAEPETENGRVYIGVVSPDHFSGETEIPGHLLALADYTSNTDYVYYTGAGWSKGGFPEPDSWFSYVKDFNTRVKHPLIVTIQ